MNASSLLNADYALGLVVHFLGVVIWRCWSRKKLLGNNQGMGRAMRMFAFV